jgi:hypothetical protein
MNGSGNQVNVCCEDRDHFGWPIGNSLVWVWGVFDSGLGVILFVFSAVPGLLLLWCAVRVDSLIMLVF